MSYTQTAEFASKARLYKTACLIGSKRYVHLDSFIPASEQFGHGAFFWVTDQNKHSYSVTPEELENYVL